MFYERNTFEEGVCQPRVSSSAEKQTQETDKCFRSQQIQKAGLETVRSHPKIQQLP